MVPYLTTKYGNASSLHSFGAEAKEAVAVARSQIAGLINANESEIVFTSGATESDNLAIKGVKPGHLVTVKTEHKAVLDSCAAAEPGFEVAAAERRDRAWQGLTDSLDLVDLNGHATKRLPRNLNVSFEFVEGGRLLEEISELAVSSGAACTTAMPEPSHVLKAIGVPEPLIASSIRFGLGRETTAAWVDPPLQIP